MVNSTSSEIVRRLLGGMLIALACILALMLDAALPVSCAGPPGSRILQFPEHHSFGTIKLIGRQGAPFAAQGKVTIPAGALVELIVNYESAHDLSPLQNLPPDALYKLTGKKLEIEGAQLRYLENLTGLVNLDLDETDVSDEGLRWLHKLNRLELLNLRASLVTGKGLVYLKPLSSLRDVSLSNDNIGDEGVENLVGMKKLTAVSVSRAQITDEALKRLAPMTQLRKLDIEFNKVTDGGIASLVGLKNLEELLISETKITPNCVRYLKQLPSLKHLIYSQHNLPAPDAVQLSKALPKCHIEEYLKHRDVQFELFEPLH